jgi:Flp pilus assembly protein TadG
MKGSSRGTALMEFALAWPIVLLLVLGAVQLAIWGSESAAARSAALAGARAGTVAGARADVAARVTLRAMSAALVGAGAAVWCPADRQPEPPLWVCATDLGSSLRVDVVGSVPSLVPIVSGKGLPIRARVVLDKEGFRR